MDQSENGGTNGTVKITHEAVEQEKSEIKRLDWVLSFMATHAKQGLEIEAAWGRMREQHPTLHREGDESNRDQIFKKLMKDGYLVYNEHNDCRYWITFDGIVFENDGGYQSMIDRQKAQDEIPRQLNLLTKILAIGTGVMALMSILTFFYR